MQVKWVVMYRSAVLLLLQGCLSAAAGGWRELKNDATELSPEFSSHTAHPAHHLQPSNNNTMNEAKNGGRRVSANSPAYEASELSCRELRITRYITDGLCRSAKPVNELVCSGQCLPAHLMLNSILRSKWWRSSSSEYRCIPAHYRMQRVQLHCPSGNSRTYKIRMVTSCKCKRFTRHHNQSDAKNPASQRTRQNKKRARFQQIRGRSREPTISSNSY
ncbi:sclerostin [Neoarius graeffei]|uniref:sclerostin n=1 Tax=Neoarius graeffei TaxID=443677 RepID=UPI00298C222A|nr:sclerostin [Neoarius graeffei]XP_060795860.1 sclerostin [Neoarius graeffei]XP_060795861.1 sclerostin [Neoarius graeffei]